MKKHVRMLIIATCVLLASVLVMSTALAASSPFTGAWDSIDSDGSYQTLRIGGGPGDSQHVRYYDFGATVCGLDPVTGDFLYAASARGNLTASGNSLTGSMPVYCQSGPPAFWGNANFAFAYDPGTDTLTDGFGIVWSRN